MFRIGQVYGPQIFSHFICLKMSSSILILEIYLWWAWIIDCKVFFSTTITFCVLFSFKLGCQSSFHSLRGHWFLFSLSPSSSSLFHQYSLWIYFCLSHLGLLCWPSGRCDSISSISFRKFLAIDFSNMVSAPISHLFPFGTLSTYIMFPLLIAYILLSIHNVFDISYVSYKCYIF